MATNDKESSAAGTDNRPPMLEESDFKSWKIRVERCIRGKPLGKLIWKSIKNGPAPHPMIAVTTGEGEQQTQVTREKTDEKFTEAENNKECADIQATNILSQGLPRHIFNTLNQTETTKENWKNVELLMQGSGLTEHNRKRPCLINMKVHQRNTKFVNNLPSYWGKYVTIVKNNNDISTWFKDEALLMEAKEKGVVLDAEVEAFLADVESTAFMANLKQTSLSTKEGSNNDTDFHAEESYLVELVCLRNTNKVVMELLQSYGQPVQTISMLSTRPIFPTKDLHKTALGHSNLLYLKTAQLCRPSLYLGDVIIDPVHTPIRVYDSEETLVQAEVSRTKMLEKIKDPLCKMSSKPVNYAKLNSLHDTFVPQKQLSRERVYWLPANEVASYNSYQYKLVTDFVRTRPTKSQVNTHWTDQCVIDNKSLEIENKNLLIQNECLIAESVSKDICSVVITSDIVVPMSVEPISNCIKEHFRNLELEAEILKSNSNVSNGIAVPEKPKVLAPGLYAMTPKYVPPQKRNNRKVNIPLPTKEKVSSVKQPNVSVNLSIGIKSVTKASKSKPRCETKTYRNLPARSENMKRVENPLRNLNKVNGVDSCLSVKHTEFISKSVSVSKTCNDCLVFGNHDKCYSFIVLIQCCKRE
nr:hypothetical protein [Tanacetum cinerariifolium]